MRNLILTLSALALALPAVGDTTGPQRPADNEQAAERQPAPETPAPQQAPADGENQGDVQNLMMELQQLSNRIETAQQQARETEEVQTALVDYARSLEEQMLEIEPDQEEAIKRKGELMVEIIRIKDISEMESEEQEEVQQKVQEHQQLSAELASVQEQALQAEEVQQKQQEAREVQIAKMQEIEPNLMQLVQQRSQIVQEIRAAHGAAQPQNAPTGS